MKSMKGIRIVAFSLIIVSFILSICLSKAEIQNMNLLVGGMSALAVILIAVSSFFIGRKPSFSFAGIYQREKAADCMKVTFENVAANENALNALKDVTEYLKDPLKFKNAGARIPHGVLLYGPPGTGKTLLARALAGEANVPFLSMNGSDFVEMYVGVGASRIREVFRKARKHGKCVIFIDEIDSLGRSRGINSSDERDQTLNALLSEMSGFKPSDGIIVIAATNRAEMLDSALLRPGRFDKRIEVGMPDIEERLAIIKLHSKNKKLSDNVDIKALAKQTVFFSGASIENLLNEAAIYAVKRNSETIEMSDIEKAYVNTVAGEDRKSHSDSNEKAQIALHEAGHAVSMKLLFPSHSLRRISIMPSSNGAAGYNLSVPEEKSIYTKRDMGNQICVLLSGRAAESMTFGEDLVSSGASNDLKRATEIAVCMVMEYGMGTRPYANESTLSKAHGAGCDGYREADEILREQYERAKALLNENFEKLLMLSRALNEREALNEKEIEQIFVSSMPQVSNERQDMIKLEKVV